MKPLYIYNLFPKLYKNTKEWEKAIPKIANMGFNSIYINPIHYPGFSGSLYAPKDYYKYNPLFFSKDKPEEEQLKDFINTCNENNIEVFMDLVINHTAFDSVLIEEHKDWYIQENGEIKRPGAWEDGDYIEWGDLATLDLDGSTDKENLWNYLYDMCSYFLDFGFKGFRCDAAYQVPQVFWQFLISKVKTNYKDILFLAETLGCTPVQIKALATCGFDYIFNSSKWWNYNDDWCLEQYNMSRKIAPSISFPETHDTERLFTEVNKNEAAFLQRLYFEALFSKGFMITSGFEYGFEKRINTVQTSPKDWEKTGRDYTKNIKKILTIKDSIGPLHEESKITVIDQSNWSNVFCFIKEYEDEKVLIILNKDINSPQNVKLENIEEVIGNEKVKDYSPENKSKKSFTEIDINLNPGEIKIFTSEKYYKK